MIAKAHASKLNHLGFKRYFVIKEKERTGHGLARGDKEIEGQIREDQQSYYFQTWRKFEPDFLIGIRNIRMKTLNLLLRFNRLCKPIGSLKDINNDLESNQKN